ncbi:hypothetical protein SCALM49S_02306 [Streptomyces californicus]
MVMTKPLRGDVPEGHFGGLLVVDPVHHTPGELSAQGGCALAEVGAGDGFADRPFPPVLGWAMVAVVLAAQGLRWWCVRTLGPRWNTRVIVVPGLPRVAGGPYRWLSRPNYVAVAAEGIALPLAHGAWLTALVFTALNAALLTVRIRCEDGQTAHPAAADARA